MIKSYPLRPKEQKEDDNWIEVCECGHADYDHKMVGFFKITNKGPCKICFCPKGKFYVMTIDEFVRVEMNSENKQGDELI